METGIDSAVIEIQGNSKSAAEALESLIGQLDTLQEKLNFGIATIENFTTTLETIQTNISSMKFNTSNLDNISQKFEPLKNIGRNTNLKNITSQLESIPDLNEKLDDKVIEQFTKKIEQLNKALEPLSTNLLRVGNALTNLPTNLNKVSSSVDKVTSKTDKLETLQTRLLNLANGVKFTALIAGLRQLANLIGKAVAQSTSYTETLNLFYVSMGEYSDRAKDFVDQFSSVLGVDPANVMRYIGDFNSLAESFGIAGEEAYIMSKNLTQLAYDISSFRNISIEDAMQKIRSGFVGEIEPMRAIGVALDEATLQETAYALGINKRISEMTRAQKTELLYYQMMQRTQYMQGDMARTLIQPANAIRVMKEQFTLLARAIGNIFIPIIMELIPYVMVLTKWLTTAAQAVANFFGFKIDTSAWENVGDIESDVSDGLGDIGDSAEEATKELNKMLAPFDELNVIDFGNDKTGTTGSGTGSIGGSLGIPTYDYDALESALTRNLEEAEKNLKNIIPYLETIGIIIGAWKIGSTVLTFLNSLGLIKNLTDALRIAGGVSLLLGGLWLLYKGVQKLIEDGELTPETVLLFMSGGTLVGAGAALMFKKASILRSAVGLSLLLGGLALAYKGIEKAIQDGGLTPEATLLLVSGTTISAIGGALQFKSTVPLKIGIALILAIITWQIGEKVGQTFSDWVVENVGSENIDITIDKVNFNTEETGLLHGWESMMVSALAAWEQTEYGKEIDWYIENWNIDFDKDNFVTSFVKVLGVSINFGLEMLADKLGSWIKGTIAPALLEGLAAVVRTVVPVFGERWATALEGTAEKFRQSTQKTVTDSVTNGIKDSEEATTDQAGTLGESLVSSLEDGISGQQDSAQTVIQSTIDSAFLNSQNPTNQTASSVGSGNISNYGFGISGGQSSAQTVIQSTINSAFFNSQNPTNQTASGVASGNMSNYNTGVMSKLASAQSTLQSTINSAISGAKSFLNTASSGLGSSNMSNYNSGILAGKGSTQTTLMNSVSSAFSSASWTMSSTAYNTGSNLSDELDRGLASNEYSVSRTAKNIGESIGDGISDNMKVNNRKLNSTLSSSLRTIRRKNPSLFSIGGLLEGALDFALSFFAGGGFPETGEMFVARESGPELVGNIGNRAAVANNDQIIEGIRQGVYEAVTQANSGNSTTPQINVYLGNKKIYSGYGSYANSENNMYGVNVIK